VRLLDLLLSKIATVSVVLKIGIQADRCDAFREIHIGEKAMSKHLGVAALLLRPCCRWQVVRTNR